MQCLAALAVVVFVSCQSRSCPDTTAANFSSSECHGFASLPETAACAYEQDSADYCQAEKIRWSYSVATGTLAILHTRQWENCASKLVMSIIADDEGYTIIERDTSDQSIRADCMCCFDTYGEIAGVAAQTVTLRYEEHCYTVDLEAGEGAIKVDSTECWVCP
jgi:hypothetical protein